MAIFRCSKEYDDFNKCALHVFSPNSHERVIGMLVPSCKQNAPYVRAGPTFNLQYRFSPLPCPAARAAALAAAVAPAAALAAAVAPAAAAAAAAATNRVDS